MKYKIVQCLSRNVVDDKDQWIYAWKVWVGGAKVGGAAINKHRVPFFLSLHAHLRIEETVEDLFNKTIFPQFAFKKLLLPYDIIHGLICGYNMREILRWWKSRTDDGDMLDDDLSFIELISHP
jgi:hypothetical protein